MKKFLAFVLIFMTILTASAEGLDFSGMTDEELQAVINGATKELESRKKTDSAVPEQDSIIADNDYIKAEFLSFESYPDMEMFLVPIRVTNKTDQEIWVYLDDASINDDMVRMVMSGVPLYVLPGKSGNNNFIFSLTQVSIDSFEDVNTVSFKIIVLNRNTGKDIWTSPEITIAKQ